MLLDSTTDMVSIIEKLGPLTAFCLAMLIFVWKGIWPWATKRQEKIDKDRAAERMRIAAIFEEDKQWQRKREETTLKDLTTAIMSQVRISERVEDHLKNLTDQLRER